jgi:type I restriction enzyme M protein
MNIVMNNDGHGGIFEANSLELTPTYAVDISAPGAGVLEFGTFKVVLTNPPFGTKIPIDNPAVLGALDFGHRRRMNPDIMWFTTGELMAKIT